MYIFFQFDSYESTSSGQNCFPFSEHQKKVFIAGILLLELDHSAKYIKGSARVH